MKMNLARFDSFRGGGSQMDRKEEAWSEAPEIARQGVNLVHWARVHLERKKEESKKKKEREARVRVAELEMLKKHVHEWQQGRKVTIR